MSETIASSSKRAIKSTCKKCLRTVYLVQIGPDKITLDPELITVIPFEGAPAKVLARRSHNEMCLKYQSDAARKKALASAKRNPAL